MTNLFVGIGRLTKDIEIRTTTSGTKIANFTLAINRDKETTDFLNCLAFNKTAEVLQDYTSKGSQIAIQGRVQTRSYEAKNGQTQYVTEIAVDRVELLDKKKEEPKVEQKKEEPTRYDKSGHLFNTKIDKQEEIPEDELPF